MAINLGTENNTFTVEVEERTYNATIITKVGTTYAVKIDRERIDTYKNAYGDIVTRNIVRENINPSAGEPDEGTDGTLPEHYSNASGGFLSSLVINFDSTTLSDQTLLYSGDITILTLLNIVKDYFDSVAIKKHDQRKLDVQISAATKKYNLLYPPEPVE